MTILSKVIIYDAESIYLVLYYIIPKPASRMSHS